MASSHRPPVLFQSDDDDQHQHPLSHHNNNNNHSHHSFENAHAGEESRSPARQGLLNHEQDDILLGQNPLLSEGYEHSQEQRYGHLYDELDNLDDPPPHVHSQTCLDSCPVQDIYTETNFSRFSKGARTNLYGLAVVKELGQVKATSFAPSTSFGLTPPNPPAQDSQMATTTTNESQFTSSSVAPDNTKAVPLANTGRVKSSIFTKTGDLMYCQLPGRYVLVAAGGTVRIFLGLQDTFEFTLNPSETGSPQNTGADAGGEGASVASASAPNLEIVSIDAFERKDERGCQLILVVAIAKAEDPVQFELRFYGVNTFASTIRDLLLQLPSTTDVQSIPLNWAPTKTIHAPLEDDPFEMVVLVGGSDSRVHVFVQDTSESASQDVTLSTGLFKEQPVENLFSVLASFPYCEFCVLSLVIKDYPTCRIIAAGTQNGTLNVGIIPRDPVTFQLDRANAKAHIIVLFAPITTLTVFTSRVPTERKWHSQMNHQGSQQAAGEDQDEVEEENGIHLLVTCAIEQAWVYSDINKHGLSRRSDLAECSYHDSILASYVMDADWDGQYEVLIGTYGRQLMVFKQLSQGQAPYAKTTGVHSQKQQQSYNHHNHHHHHQQQQQHIQSARINHNSTQHPQRQLRNSLQLQQQQQQHIHLSEPTVSSPSAIGDSGDRMSLLPQWGMTWNRRFASPVYGISSADLNDDGLEELVITTINGVSFFMPDPQTAKRRLTLAVERMHEIEKMREILEQLRRENQRLVEDQHAKEEKEKAEEEEEERQKHKMEEEEEKKREEEKRETKKMEEEEEDEQKRQDDKVQESPTEDPKQDDNESEENNEKSVSDDSQHHFEQQDQSQHEETVTVEEKTSTEAAAEHDKSSANDVTEADPSHVDVDDGKENDNVELKSEDESKSVLRSEKVSEEQELKE
ncbi:hypothetical protein FBU30_007616 [Linnemannia zychae]|nr:hypothetical protein FBU30_007616 [Linnemannia zychae]